MWEGDCLIVNKWNIVIINMVRTATWFLLLINCLTSGIRTDKARRWTCRFFAPKQDSIVNGKNYIPSQDLLSWRFRVKALIIYNKNWHSCPAISFSGVCLILEQRYSFWIHILGDTERLVLWSEVFTDFSCIEKVKKWWQAICWMSAESWQMDIGLLHYWQCESSEVGGK